ncbi:MAG: hypothetical protein JRJ09_14860 [Deltaproteobacteria bacterium]|nr:hypothetical protein [Deltaproteobacteria bacterium]
MKKNAVFCSIFILVFLATLKVAADMGDVNCNQKIDLEDAILALQAIIQKPLSDSFYSLESDVNNDDRIGIEEAIYILRFIAAPPEDYDITGTWSITRTATDINGCNEPSVEYDVFTLSQSNHIVSGTDDEGTALNGTISGSVLKLNLIEYDGDNTLKIDYDLNLTSETTFEGTSTFEVWQGDSLVCRSIRNVTGTKG